MRETVLRTLHARTRPSFALLAAAATAATVACGGSGPGVAPSAPPASAVGVAPSTAELEALYRARADSALLRFTEADAAFMALMMGHHAQALDMARLAPTRGASPSVRTLAARVINAQQDEIATMRRWLEDRGRPAPEPGAGTTTPPVPAAADHAAHSPGMLTSEQMGELERASGRAFDRLFLTSMIQHHHGAVTMVRELFATDGAAQDPSVFKIGSDIQVDQLTEIARMERMLEALPGAAR
jgi:uncharacterized protein (DUF305 family)